MANDLQTNLDIIDDFTQRLQVAVIGAEETTAKHEHWVEGTSSEVIQTINGPIKTLRGLIADWDALFQASFDSTIESYDSQFAEKLVEYDNDFLNYLLNIGFEPAEIYQGGITIERRSQTVAYGGVTYYWAGALPFTTTGVFANEADWLIAPIVGGIEIPQITFATGGNLVRKTQSVLGTDGEWYFWTGSFPKTISVASTLESAGGVGLNKFKLASGHVPVRPMMKILSTAAGFVLNAGSFEYGATITSSSQVLPELNTGRIWKWDGPIPKVVDLNSSPASSGGVGENLWNEVVTATGSSGSGITIGATKPTGVGSGHRWYCTTDGRTYVYYADGDSVQWVEESPQGSVFDGLEPRVQESLRRSYAEAGYNVVGTFHGGFTLVNVNDVGIDEATGKGYTGPAGVVVAGTDPTSGGFVDRSGEILHDKLALDSGAAMVGTASGETVQEEFDALKNFAATGANVPYSPQDRARRQLSASDFTPESTDLGAAVNAVRASLETEYSPSSSVGIRGGDCELPRGTKASLTPINLERHSSGTSSFSIEGQGQSTTQLDMTGAPALTDGITGGGGGATFGELSNFSIKSAPRSGVRLGKYSRMTLRNLDMRNSGAAGYYLGNGFVTVMEKLTSNFNAASGFTFDVTLQHTSHVINGGYAFQNSGSGWDFGLMNYCAANALASDNNTLYGYTIAKSDGFVLNGCGAESNGRSAFVVLSSTANGATKNTTINNAFAYHNNLSNAGYPNLLYALAANGEAAHVRISKSKSIPNAGDTTKDIIADGVGAEIEIDDCEMPNGWESRNGGYIHWRHKTLVVRGLTVPVAPTATPICNLLSTQGHKVRYAGRVTVLASNQQPSTGERNTAIYELLVSKSVLQGPQVVVIAEAGMVAGATTSGQSQPAFDFSLVNDQLVVTPRQSTGGVPFWFEIDTSSQIVAMSL